VERRQASLEAGDRYVLQYANGLERLALAQRAAQGDAAMTLRPIEAEHPLPPEAMLAGEWLVGPRDRVIRDGRGCYWCVTSRVSHRRAATGGSGLLWRVQFERFTADGHPLRYAAESRHEPPVMPDAELVEILRQACGQDG
jgi:hypothetical protein